MVDAVRKNNLAHRLCNLEIDCACLGSYQVAGSGDSGVEPRDMLPNHKLLNLA